MMMAAEFSKVGLPRGYIIKKWVELFNFSPPLSLLRNNALTYVSTYTYAAQSVVIT